jgi:hypothetical protein
MRLQITITKLITFYLSDYLSFKKYLIKSLNYFSTMYCIVYIFIYIFAL